MRAIAVTFAAAVAGAASIASFASAAELSGDTGLPSPQVGLDLFAAVSASQPECASGVAVISELRQDETKVGGTVVALSGEVGQQFADMWRRHLHEATVPVTLIIGHLFPNPLNAEMLVDTVEFDAHGCAMSRTLLPAGEWGAILHDAAGEEA